MEDSVKGLPAAFIWIISLFIYVAMIGIFDYIVIKTKGVEYSITYGVRHIWKHFPLLAMVLVLLGGGLVFGFFVHIAAILYVP